MPILLEEIFKKTGNCSSLFLNKLYQKNNSLTIICGAIHKTPAIAKRGIGTTTPSCPLSFKSGLGHKIILWGDGNVAHYGLGIQSGSLQLHSDLPGSDIIFGTGTSSLFTERTWINTFGGDGLNVNGRMVLKNGTNPEDLNYGSGEWMYNANNSALLGFMGVQNNQNLGFMGATVDVDLLIIPVATGWTSVIITQPRRSHLVQQLVKK